MIFQSMTTVLTTSCTASSDRGSCPTIWTDREEGIWRFGAAVARPHQRLRPAGIEDAGTYVSIGVARGNGDANRNRHGGGHVRASGIHLQVTGRHE
jgi:hypothetical protein